MPEDTEYRERYGLKADYPMTAPAYSEHRREVAKTLGLGRKPGSAKAAASAAASEPEAPAADAKPDKTAKPDKAATSPKRRGRPFKAAAAPDGGGEDTQPATE